MDEAQAINLLIQAVHKGQARGSFELMEAYTLAAAVETAQKLVTRLQENQNEVAKAKIIADDAIEKATPKANGEEKPNEEKEPKVGHEAEGAPELLKEIVVDSPKKDDGPETEKKK